MKILITCCMLFLMTAMHAQQPIEGIWNTGNNNTKIEITENQGVLQGKIHSSDNAKAQIGKALLKEVAFIDGDWKGKLFAAKRGEWMEVVLKEDGDQLVLTVGSGWKSKTLKWSRD